MQSYVYIINAHDTMSVRNVRKCRIYRQNEPFNKVAMVVHFTSLSLFIYHPYNMSRIGCIWKNISIVQNIVFKR